MRIFAGIPALLLMFLVFFVVGCGRKPSITRDKVQEAWDEYNDPALLDSGAVVVFSDLPSSGSSNRVPWSDVYWPSYLGGIAVRWRNGSDTPFSQQRLTEEQVRSLSQEQLAGLSPAEKYDIFMGRFDFPTVQSEMLRTHPSMARWYGLCHGWSAATLNFEEPGAVTLRGSSEIDVFFSSGDVKALLAYAQGVVFTPMVRVLGQRCDSDLVSQPYLDNASACRDTNAGSFHLVLANYVGRAGQIILADFTRGQEVWNFPIYGFSTRELGRRAPSVGAALNTTVEVVVETSVDFIFGLDKPNVLPLGDSRTVVARKMVFQYVLELDAFGRVVGGSWISEARPDFVWVQERANFRGYYGNIESIYERSLIGSSNPSPAPASGSTPILTPTPPNSQPMGPILTQPIPIPTLPPMPTPAPVPTVSPVPIDVPADPGNMPRPGLPVFSALNCPVGTFLVNSGFLFCSDGIRAFAPVTAEMSRVCKESGAFGCHDPLWSNQLYSAMRGSSICPIGAAWDFEVSGCVENNLVLGPFDPHFTSECLRKGFGNACLALKLELVYFNLVMLRI